MRLGLKALTAGLTLAGTTAIATPAAAVQTENLPTLTQSGYVPGGAPVVERTFPDYAKSKFASVRVMEEKYLCDAGRRCLYEHTEGGARTPRRRSTTGADASVPAAHHPQR